MDVRAIPCSVKHGAIIGTFQKLPVGDHFILWNDHNPLRIRDQITAHWPGTFSWEYLIEGVGGYQVKITKLKPLADAQGAVAAFDCGH